MTKEFKFEDKQLALKRLKMPHKGNHKWPVEKRIEVVTHQLALGNMRHVSAITGVPWATIRLWREQEWWHTLEAEIKASRRAGTNTKLSKIVEKALIAVEDRIDNGNFFYDFKTQELRRQPISVLEATKVANDLMQRQAGLEAQSLAEVQHQQTQTIQDQLVMLAQEFSKFNKARTVDVVAMEVTDALPEEWEEKLQGGSGEVYESSFSGEEEGGAEQSAEDDGEEGFSS